MKHTDIVEGIIESRHRGVYDDIANQQGKLSTDKNELNTILGIAFSLYHILEKRRRKEGKISFESTEIYFDFGESNGIPTTKKTPIGIKNRERNDAHKLIEEFMVLANEEVAKWCNKNGLPFLSRVHGLPGNEQTQIIQDIIQDTVLIGKK